MADCKVKVNAGIGKIGLKRESSYGVTDTNVAVKYIPLHFLKDSPVTYTDSGSKESQSTANGSHLPSSKSEALGNRMITWELPEVQIPKETMGYFYALVLGQYDYATKHIITLKDGAGKTCPGLSFEMVINNNFPTGKSEVLKGCVITSLSLNLKSCSMSASGFAKSVTTGQDLLVDSDYYSESGLEYGLHTAVNRGKMSVWEDGEWEEIVASQFSLNLNFQFTEDERVFSEGLRNKVIIDGVSEVGGSFSILSFEEESEAFNFAKDTLTKTNTANNNRRIKFEYPTTEIELVAQIFDANEERTTGGWEVSGNYRVVEASTILPEEIKIIVDDNMSDLSTQIFGGV